MENKINCNMCHAELEYYDYKGTHIWVCPDCMNVQFEFIGIEDINNLKKFLKDKLE